MTDILSIIASSKDIHPDVAAGIKAEQERMSKMTPEEKRQHIENCFNNSIGNLEDCDCPVCKNRGFIVHVDDNFEKSFTRCKCMETRITNRMLKNSGLYDKVQELTFENYIATEEWQRKCLQTARQYAENASRWFFIGGQSGAGKTHLCTAITAKLIKQGKRAKYMLWRDEVVKLKQSATDFESYQAQMHLLQTVPVLYIDDFLKTAQGQKPTQADIDKAFEILNVRYNNKLITIISSELTIDNIIDVDEAIAGRINEMAKGHCLNLKKDTSRNYRLRSEEI